ncbi:MAG: hypothetical protein PUP93_12080 [Rhizonema sp. NSF051]|nr:hypothetical protein [Rhizonema sp. NSF051]
MFKQLQEKDNYREYCRQAIAEALARDERLAEKLKRDSQSSEDRIGGSYAAKFISSSCYV